MMDTIFEVKKTQPRKQRSLAQQRRMMENIEFEKLSAELPIARAISGQHIDKTSVVRLAATFVRLNDYLTRINVPFNSNSMSK
ncbi:hypothetical protein AB6A40_010269 [Gnathostoma spinigerum]|uniref:BHLH domain-containing protein n=1 Tax=Gnathostoma spinigerum TaxID=75299 RepID=A0ABD6EVN9_9BILA